MNTISFMTANYVAREVGYTMTRGWGQGDKATNEAFAPLATFEERFDALLGGIRALGFDAIDLWLAHLSPSWTTPEHIAIARELLDRHGLRVMSLAGWFGSNIAEFEASCKLAVALHVPVLGGSTSALAGDRDAAVGLLKQHGLRLGIENHPEKTPAELLEKIGDGGDGTVGAAVDTGWFGTQGYDAAQALVELKDHLFLVHLKDVRAAGAHDTCRYGDGIVPIKGCVDALKQIGYRGSIAVEHEPELYDPTDEVRESYAMLKAWLA